MQDWAYGALGGLMIGLAAAIYLGVNGRILGASGILGGLVDRTGLRSWRERLAFLAGVVLVPAGLARGMSPETHLTSNPVLLIAAGLLVGLGTRLANGCTSGHGVCGMSRFSLRGFVATVFYLLGGAVALYLGRHVAGVI